MTSDDYESFLALLKNLAHVYRRELDDAQIEFYWNALKDREFADIQRRVDLYSKRGRFFPSAADMRPKELVDPASSNDQLAKAQRELDAFNREDEKRWNIRLREDPLATKLAMCEALEARYSIELDRGSIALAEKRGYQVIERAIMPEEMSGFEQCFLAGTAAEVTPVSEIGPYTFAVGDITRMLMDDFTALIHPARVRAAAVG